MKSVTATDLIEQISLLNKEYVYTYTSGNSRLKILDIVKPEGPVRFVNINDDGSTGEIRRITVGQLALMASICSSRPNYPLHIDRVLSGGGNTRSALEAVLAHTPHFFMSRPRRIKPDTGQIAQDLKHIIWCPDETHELGKTEWKEYTEVITEQELALRFDQITIPQTSLGEEFESIDAKRTHVQIQIALVTIGRALGFKTWVAQNDRSIGVGDKKLGELDGVVRSLNEMSIFHTSEIRDAATFIDCIWFTSDGKRVPAIIEIEHSTGVTSGATRMKKFYDSFPSLQTIFVIVADDSLRHKASVEANQPIFWELALRFMSYNTVKELYGLLLKYELGGSVDHRFIQPFLEKLVKS